MATWKAVERKIASILGGTRSGPQGRAVADSLDIPWLAPEIKHRDSLPQYLEQAMQQAEQNAEGKLPIVVWHYKRQPYLQSYVMLRLGDFADHFCYPEKQDAPSQ